MVSSTYTLKSVTFLRLFGLILITLNLTFRLRTLVGFYFIFETALLPIFLIILGWGYQPERLMARINLFLYTVAASLPLFLIFLTLSYSNFNSTFRDLLKTNLTNSLGGIIPPFLALGLLTSFIVKYPLFFVHLWLPKAHVEAPVAGSIILAAILLKLGGYGLLRTLPIIAPNTRLVFGLIAFSLIGGGLISRLCLRQTDIKVLIAYSSVAHIRLAIAASLTCTLWGLLGAYLIILAHGLASSGLFSAANLSYERFKTRNILLAKRLLTFLPSFSLGWFLLCIANMGAPPSLNLLREIFRVIRLLGRDYLFILPLSATLMLAVAFSLLLYASTQQPQPRTMNPKIPALSLRELLIFFLHVLPIFLLPIALNNSV